MCPDDSADGGTIDFDFSSPTLMDSVTFIDIDDSPATTMTIFTSNGSSETIVVTGSGNNGVIDVAVNRSDVVKLSVHLAGSGAISGLKYVFCEPPTLP